MVYSPIGIDWYRIIRLSNQVNQVIKGCLTLDSINISYLLAVSWYQLNQINFSLDLENRPIDIDWYRIIWLSNRSNWVIRIYLTLTLPITSPSSLDINSTKSGSHLIDIVLGTIIRSFDQVDQNYQSKRLRRVLWSVIGLCSCLSTNICLIHLSGST